MDAAEMKDLLMPPGAKKLSDAEVAAEIRQILKDFHRLNVTMTRQEARKIPDPVASFDRLIWLLELSPEERAFVRDTAERPRYYPMFLIYCDWLVDQGRHSDAGNLERLVPRKGDVLVVTFPKDGDGARKAAMELIDEINKYLAPFDRQVQGIGLPDNWKIENLTPEMMRENGWIRAAEQEEGFQHLFKELDGQPEQQPGGTASVMLLAMIKRLKNENETLKYQLDMARDTEQMALRERNEAQDDLENFRKRVKR